MKSAPQTEETRRQQEALTREIIATEQELRGLTNEYEQFGSKSKKSLTDVGNSFKDVGEKVTAVGQGIATVGAGITAAEVAMVAAAKAGVDYVDSVAEVGDAIDKNSQKLGVSAQFYQEWEQVLQHSGTSMDSMTSSYKTLAKASQDATKSQEAAFEKLGLSSEMLKKCLLRMCGLL